ncbi:MAG: nucleotide sugar dehydrogenase [Candidatus Marinimicrobia bacterium]|nr:nucleotide sugar dehydrogenase [Candidatus Neomarinimicrobiota bacterium]
MTSLTQIIKSKEATIGIIGLGYVGLPLAIRFSEVGFKVIGFDIDEHKVNMLNDGKSYIKHISEDVISKMIDQGFLATMDFTTIKDVDAILICVPTPLGVHNEPDLSYVKSTLDLVKDHLREEQVLILESTTYPGTTAEEIVPVIEALGFKVGENFYIGYSPEREDPGNKNFSTQTIPKVVSGHTKKCLEVTTALYDQIVDTTVPVSSTQVAEMTKILENIHRAVNIGLVNELKMVADKMNIDINEVIKAAATKPFGFTAYYPGPGLGGHCIPIDPFYLTWKAKEVGMNTRFIELAGEINTGMPEYGVRKVGEVLNNVEKSIKGSRILVLGLAYKKNIDDIRESSSLEIIDLLLKKGANVQYSDPFISQTHKTRKNNFNLKSVKINKETLSKIDLVLLATDHDDFDYELIKQEAKLIIDTRGKFSNKDKTVFKA